MVRATAAPAARPNLAVAAEVRLALPWPRTTSAARRGGQGGGGAGRFRLAGARGDLSPSSLRNRQRLRTQHPRPRAPPRCRRSPPPAPRARRDPPDERAGRSEPAPLERRHTWRPQVYSLENAPEALGEETAREVHALGRLSVEPKPQDIHPTTPTRVARAGPSARSKRHFSPSPPTPSEPLLLPVRTVPAFSCSVTISQNPITSRSKPPPIGQWGG
uniref:serine/arginine repetitive matrix protein 3-like n=1 Tax=Halichoerus grypus TaxID=9711 RepID=UPI0016590487|nr:serine/arginine repetitive matrix protein 3-like [Halichoerus grypus]